MSTLMKEGMGAHNFWGLTPAKDVLMTDPYIPQSEIFSALILQPGDCGHILKTIAYRRRHPGVSSISLYVYEKEPEALARLLLLLYISQDRTFPLRHRVNTFLEVYGNTVIQERTAMYVEQVGKALIEMVNGGGDEHNCLGNLVNLSYLKYKEKDALETVFRSWSLSQPCDIESLRDFRIRNMLGTRYDARDACADWDYQFRLKNQASIIHIKQYKKWRRSGIAFEFGDQLYNHPNRTMVSFAEGVLGSRSGINHGLRKEVMGFWLDIRCSPYFTFGVECNEDCKDASELFKIVNKGTGVEQHRHHTVDISVYNVLSVLWEQDTGRPYCMSLPNDVYSGIGETTTTTISPLVNDEDGQYCSRNSVLMIPEPYDNEHAGDADVVDVHQREAKLNGCKNGSSEVIVMPENKKDDIESRSPPSPLVSSPSGLKIHLLCGDWNFDHCGKSKHKDIAFDSVTLSHASAHLLDGASGNALCTMVADSALLRVSTAKYVVPFEKESKLRWNNRVLEMAETCGWENVEQIQVQDEDNTGFSSSLNDELVFVRKVTTISNS